MRNGSHTVSSPSRVSEFQCYKPRSSAFEKGTQTSRYATSWRPGRRFSLPADAMQVRRKYLGYLMPQKREKEHYRKNMPLSPTGDNLLMKMNYGCWPGSQDCSKISSCDFKRGACKVLRAETRSRTVPHLCPLGPIILALFCVKQNSFYRNSLHSTPIAPNRVVWSIRTRWEFNSPRQREEWTDLSLPCSGWMCELQGCYQKVNVSAPSAQTLKSTEPFLWKRQNLLLSGAASRPGAGSGEMPSATQTCSLKWGV